MPTRLLCPCHFPSKNTGVGCHSLLQGIFLTQGSNPHLLCLLHCQTGSLPAESLGRQLENKQQKKNNKKKTTENLLAAEHSSRYILSQPSEAGTVPLSGKLRLDGFADWPVLCSWTPCSAPLVLWLLVQHFPLLLVFLSLPSSGCWAVLGLPRKNVSSQGLLLWWLPVNIFIIYKMKMVVCSRCPRQARLALSLQESQSPLIILKMSTAWKVTLVPGTKKANKKHVKFQETSV